LKGFKTYKDLKIWIKGIELVAEVYSATKQFPSEELYGLSSQMRRSAVSIPSNIAEGWGRESNKSFIQFLRISKASLFELETQIIIAFNLNYVSQETRRIMEEMIEEEGKMINAFIKAIKN
jgi:four helix bundle protein